MGGTEFLTNDISQEFVARGYDVYWLAVDPNNKTNHILKGVSNNLTTLALPKLIEGSYPKNWLKQEKRVSSLISTEFSRLNLPIFDAIHLLHFIGIGLDFLSLPIFTYSKLIVTCTDYSFICADSQLYRFHKKQICSNNTLPRECIQCLNNSTHEDDIVSWRARNIRFLNHAVNHIYFQTPHQRNIFLKAGCHTPVSLETARYLIPDKWQPKTSASLPYSFAFFGRLSEEKGLQVILPTFKKLHAQTGATLHIYGIADHGKTSTLDLVAQTKNPYILLHEPLPLTELGSAIISHDCILMPSIWLENHSLMLSYALALNVSVLHSQLPSIEHLNHPNLNLAGANEPSDWHEKMLALARTKRHYPQSSKQLIQINTEFNAFIKNLESVYFMR